MSDLAYLRQELKFTAQEWSKLTDTDKVQLRQWAKEEMAILGVPIDAPARPAA